MLRNRMLAILVFMFCLAAVASAQGGATGAISGTVQDASGAVIPRAKVSIESQATRQVLRHLTSDSAGLFTASFLPVGVYTVEVTAPGFAVTRFAGLILRITEATHTTATI